MHQSIASLFYNAPEGATHFVPDHGRWQKIEGGHWYVWHSERQYWVQYEQVEALLGKSRVIRTPEGKRREAAYARAYWQQRRDQALAELARIDRFESATGAQTYGLFG